LKKAQEEGLKKAEEGLSLALRHKGHGCSGEPLLARAFERCPPTHNHDYLGHDHY